MINIHAFIGENSLRVGNTLFISIDGHGGSGKSTLAKELAKHINAEVIQTDDFASMDNPRDWWPNLVKAVFNPVKSGATVLNYGKSKWWPTHQPEPVINQRVSEVMILEGVGSSRVEFRQYLGLSIFVDAPSELCMNRGLARDRLAGSP